MPPVNLLIKPASSNCNMCCSYCFYTDEAEHRLLPSFGIMSQKTLEVILKKALAYAKGWCSIAFQGGEPTLAGIDFFRKAVEIVQCYRPLGLEVQFSIQTNGLLIDKEWVGFLSENNFLVGLSLDGPKEIHDRYRVDKQGKGTYNRVMQAAQRLQQAGAKFNILTVLTGPTAASVDKVSGFFERNNYKYQQFIPCLDPIDTQRGEQTYSLSPDQYFDCLVRLFSRWYSAQKSGHPFFNRYFDDLAGLVSGEPPEECALCPHCGIQYVVEADGSVYPCDFFAIDQWKLGNLLVDSFQQLDEQRLNLKFIETSAHLPQACGSCRWKKYCMGGCFRDRFSEQNGEVQNYFCSAYSRFLEFALPRLCQLKEEML